MQLIIHIKISPDFSSHIWQIYDSAYEKIYAHGTAIDYDAAYLAAHKKHDEIKVSFIEEITKRLQGEGVTLQYYKERSGARTRNEAGDHLRALGASYDRVSNRWRLPGGGNKVDKTSIGWLFGGKS